LVEPKWTTEISQLAGIPLLEAAVRAIPSSVERENSILLVVEPPPGFS
jgi:hypothetical protein